MGLFSGLRRTICSSIMGAGVLVILTASYSQPVSAQSPALVGRWIVEFSQGSSPAAVQFDAQASGTGTFLPLDPVSHQPLSSSSSPASWTFNGQSPAIFSFTITGQAQLPQVGGALQAGSLLFAASAALETPVTALTGWGQFDPAGGGPRGSEPPSFNFTATQVSDTVPAALSVNGVSTEPARKAFRGRDLTINWTVQAALALTSQQILISLDGGESFQVVSDSIDPVDRSYAWSIPSSFPKARSALIKVTATDASGNSSSGVTGRPFRIK